MPADKLIFADSEKARNAITTAEAKRIQKLYEEWADEVGKLADFYKRKTTDSSFVTEQQLKSLKKKLTEAGKEISGKVNAEIKNSIYQVSSAVVDDNIAWLASLGFDQGALNVAFSSVPKQIVNRLLTGQLYESGWSLSKAIWSSNQKAMKDIYEVVAGGIAQNESVYEIAKKIEAYVDPSKRRPWNLFDADGRKIYPRRVDYNAQRLVRTLVQHSYQQSFIETTKDNPFITEYIWVSNGSRVCPICKARDGTRYPKDALPMDHPNGMCTMVPDVSKNLNKQLEDWFNSPDGTYPEIDKFAGNFGYNTNKKLNVKTNLRGLSKEDIKLAKSTKMLTKKEYKDWAKTNPLTQEDLAFMKVNKSKGATIYNSPNFSAYTNNYRVDMADTSKSILDKIDSLVDSDEFKKQTAVLHAFKDDYKNILFGAGDITKDDIGRTIFTGNRYLSTTVDRAHPFVDINNNEYGRDYLLKIVAPKGTKAFPSTNFDESEILLGRNLEMEVVDVAETISVNNRRIQKVITVVIRG